MGRPRKSRQDLPARVYFRHGAYYFVDQAGKWNRLAKDYASAMRRFAELLHEGTSLETMSQLFDRYQREVLPNKAPSTQRTNLYELKLLRQAFGHLRAEEIRPKYIYQYMDARDAPIRANREKALLSHVFKSAIRWGVIDTNPCQFVEKFKERPRTRYIEDAEFVAVYDIATPVIQAAMMLSYITGLRQGDVLTIRLQNLTDRGIELTTGKTQRKMVFEWNDELVATVERAKRLRGSVSGFYLICTRQGQRYSGSGFRAMWNRVMTKAMRQGLLVERFTFHDIRAKAGTDSEDENLLGHLDPRTLTRHYKRKPLKVTPIRARVLDKA